MPVDALPLRTSVAAAPATAERSGRRRPDRSERRLAARLRNGDPDALAEAYRTYGAATYGFLVRLLGDRARRRGRPAAGLHRGLAARGRLRPAARRPADMDADDRAQPRDRSPTPARPRAARPALPDPRTVPADADALLERWRVAHLLGRLPENERALLRLRFYDELSQSEIAPPPRCPSGPSRRAWCAGSPACAR